MKIKVSIASLLVLTLILALAIRVWQISRPLDHFQLDVAGTLESKLPPDTRLKVMRSPDYHRSVDCELELGQLPAGLPRGYPDSGCVVEFWAAQSGTDQRLFSIVVDKELFDSYRVITLRLDKPKPVLHPDFDFWATQAWSARITQRMRYRELPWMDKATRSLAPMPKFPEMIVARQRNGEILERCPLEQELCLLDYYFANFAVDTKPELEDGEDIVFSVTYDSKVFEPIKTEFQFRYNANKDKL